ncbi:hypothetical protein EDB89DRAFT_1983155 [Lactarius sanguifluus]|nr:hypothetical protein EDB89DRAFT_1983155 [Lactarius sanguifluus]
MSSGLGAFREARRGEVAVSGCRREREAVEEWITALPRSLVGLLARIDVLRWDVSNLEPLTELSRPSCVFSFYFRIRSSYICFIGVVHPIFSEKVGGWKQTATHQSSCGCSRTATSLLSSRSHQRLAPTQRTGCRAWPRTIPGHVSNDSVGPDAITASS